MEKKIQPLGPFCPTDIVRGHGGLFRFPAQGWKALGQAARCPRRMPACALAVTARGEARVARRPAVDAGARWARGGWSRAEKRTRRWPPSGGFYSWGKRGMVGWCGVACGGGEGGGSDRQHDPRTEGSGGRQQPQANGRGRCLSHMRQGRGQMGEVCGPLWAGWRGPDRVAQWVFLIIQNNLNEFELIWLKDKLILLENFQINM
jgi:hypothetical protein